MNLFTTVGDLTYVEHKSGSQLVLLLMHCS